MNTDRDAPHVKEDIDVESVDSQSTHEERPRFNIKMLGGVVAAAVAGGALTALVTLWTAREATSVERDRLAFEIASQTPTIETQYWFGPPVGLLIKCATEGTENINPDCLTLLPRDRSTFRLVLSDGDWSTAELPSFDVDAVTCVTTSCSNSLAGGQSEATLWLVLSNDGDQTIRDIEIEWRLAADLLTEIDLASATFVGGETSFERIGDLAPGEGAVIALSRLIYWPNYSRFPRKFVRVGDNRLPVKASFETAGSRIEQVLRGPADSVQLVDNGTEWNEEGGG